MLPYEFFLIQLDQVYAFDLHYLKNQELSAFLLFQSLNHWKIFHLNLLVTEQQSWFCYHCFQRSMIVMLQKKMQNQKRSLNIYLHHLNLYGILSLLNKLVLENQTHLPSHRRLVPLNLVLL